LELGEKAIQSLKFKVKMENAEEGLTAETLGAPRPEDREETDSDSDFTTEATASTEIAEPESERGTGQNGPNLAEFARLYD
jgi:hypothetical protein